MNQHIECSRGGLQVVCEFLLLSAILISVACEKAPVKPVNIGPNDICFYCKSPITNFAFAAEFIAKDGFVRKFDDIGCLIAYTKKIGKQNIQAFFFMDAQSRTWFPANQIHFVRSDKMQTPRNGGIIAFRDASKAQQAASQNQGELVKFEDLIK